MHMQPTAPSVEQIHVRSGIAALSGYGLDIRVERGQLAVRDGIGASRRDGTFHRATSRLRRLVVLGHTGTISLDAIRWLHDVGAAYLQIDRDGVVLASFGPNGTNRPALRRAQALAMGRPTGIEIGRRLLREKLATQAETLGILAETIPVDPDASRVITNLAEALDTTEDPAGLRQVEARAALAYWGAWKDLPVRFAHRDTAKVPTHWTTFGSRTSSLTGGPRLATNPANAVLNYLYALLEAEASIAAHVVGLDPGLGVVHADQLNRDSLALDLMEPIRPMVDRYVIDLLANRRFAARDFFETREGVCRIMPTLAKELAQTTMTWYRAVGKITEDVALVLEHREPERRTLPSPISERRRSIGRTRAVTEVNRRCSSCGAQLTDRRRMTCGDECESIARAAQDISGFVGAGPARLRELAAQGVDPARAPEAIAKLRVSQARRRREQHEWDRTHERPDDGVYRDRVLPNVRRMTVGDIVRLTGLSPGRAGQIRRGDVIPHPRWWESLTAEVRP